MRIFGNFQQFGEWSTPDPGFEGHIIVEDDGKFIGYHDELYGVVEGMESLDNDLNRIRFVFGYIANNNINDAEGIAFFKLSQDDDQSPIVYVIPDFTDDSSGSWAAPGFLGYFDPQGRAKVTVEEVAESEEITSKINNLHELIKDSTPTNDELLGLAEICLEMLQNLELN